MKKVKIKHKRLKNRSNNSNNIGNKRSKDHFRFLKAKILIILLSLSMISKYIKIPIVIEKIH